MTERVIVQDVVEYVVNCAWEIPLLAAGAWVLIKIVKPQTGVQHGLWLSVLAMAVLLPSGRFEELPGVQRSLPGAASVSSTAAPMPRRAEQAGVEKESVVEAGAPRSDVSVRKAEVSSYGRGLLVRLCGRNRLMGVSMMGASTMRLIATMYLVSLLAGAVRLARGLIATRRLVRMSREMVLAPRTQRLLDEFCRRSGVAMPRLRESSEAAGPAIVGAWRPVMLLPERFEEHAEDEIGAALLHELAHVRRRDYLVNLICQMVALPVAWHPAVYLVQQRIRRTREMACDAIAAGEMESGAEYARCLVSLARRMMSLAQDERRMQAMGLFENNTIEERVMKLTEMQVTFGARAKALRLVSGAAAMMGVTATALTFHVKPTFAAADIVQQSAPAVSAVPPKPSAQVMAPEKGTLAIARGNHSKVTTKKGDYVHRWKTADGEPFALVNRDPKEPTAEEQSLAESQLAGSQAEIDAAMKGLNDAKLKLQMEDLEKMLNGVEMKRQFAKADKLMNDPAMKQRMDELQEKLSRIDTLPELKKFNDPEWLKQFAGLQTLPKEFKFDFDLGKQITFADPTINQAKLDELMTNGKKDRDEQMAKLKNEMESGELKRKLEEATRLLQDVKKQMETMRLK